MFNSCSFCIVTNELWDLDKLKSGILVTVCVQVKVGNVLFIMFIFYLFNKPDRDTTAFYELHPNSRQPFWLSSIRFVLFSPKMYKSPFICPATINDILKSVLIFLPESNRNSQRPTRCLPTLHWCYPARARTAVIGLNTSSLWPLSQYTESLSGCSVIITAKGNVHASVNVRECACVLGVKSIFLFGWSSCQQQQNDARNDQIVGRIWTKHKPAAESALGVSDVCVCKKHIEESLLPPSH